MNFIIILFFAFFLLIIYLDRSYANRIVKNEIKKLNKLENRVIYQKINASCSNFTSGRKKLGFHYRNADLYFLEDAFIIVGSYFIFSKKIFRSFLVLTHHVEDYKSIFSRADNVLTPKRLNLKSSNGEVYIEFGEASFTSTNVSIRLKNLSEAEKERINI